jgi:hypothetical protein
MSRIGLPGIIRQFAYVVAPDELDDAIDGWTARGVGPWYFMRELRQSGYVHRGVASEPVLTLGFANSGTMQIELITAHDDAPSPFREFLDAGSRGFHHHAWWVEDWASWSATAAAANWQPMANGDGGGSAQWAYYDIGGPGYVEVMELNAATTWLATTVADAHASWDGSTDPVRSLF